MSLWKPVAAVCMSVFLYPGRSLAEDIEFNRDIRPILSDHCFTCHGPDAANRKTRLRFDIESGAKVDLGKNRYAILPGDPQNSEIIRRITSQNPAVRMPPAYAGRARLNDRDIEKVRQWIAQGAHWQPFWSFIPPKGPTPPAVEATGVGCAIPSTLSS